MCPKCGALDTQKEFEGSFCADCFAQDTTLFGKIKTPELRVCQTCKRAFFNGKWKELTEESLSKWMKEKIDTKRPLQSMTASWHRVNNGLMVKATLAFTVASRKVERKAQFLLRVHQTCCDQCRKRSGGYHEAIIQLRGENMDHIRRLAVRLTKLINEESFVTGIEERKEGIDLQVGSKNYAMEVIRQLRKPFTVAHKLIGMKEGKRQYRASVCLRI